MPFKNGKYEHESGFIVKIANGEIFVTPNAPLSLRISDLFDKEKWKEVK